VVEQRSQSIGKPDPRFPFRAVKRLGWAREWFIVNAMGGHVDGFTGTKRQADAEAARLERIKRGAK
jgi:hypothetical protein